MPDHTFTFTDEELLCLQVCLQNAPTPYHISKKKIVGDVEDKIGKPPVVKKSLVLTLMLVMHSFKD